MDTLQWRSTIEAPDAAADALVATTTGWPASVAAPSPLRWAEAIMVGVHEAVSDRRWGADVLSLRLTEAWITSDAPAEPKGPVTATTTLLQVVDLGALSALRLGVEVRAGRRTQLAEASVTIAASGPGLTDGTRPLSPVLPSAPGRSDRTGAAAVAWSAERAADPAAVSLFATWSRDTTPIHHDPEAARAAGLPGPIAPGMFVLGMLAAAAAEALQAPIWGIGARFVRPTPVGAGLAVSVTAPAESARAALGASGSSGPVVRRAWAQLP